MDAKYLLDDAAMRDFIVNGYMVFKPDLPADLSRTIHERTADLVRRECNLKDNLQHQIPELQQVLNHPQVQGALTSILGPDYALYHHNALHLGEPGSAGQKFHKDGQVVGNVRYHRPRWAMAMYYPQDTPDELAPTAIKPGTQYYVEPDRTAPELPLCGEAGTVIIVHYELWHARMPSRSDKTRQMHKFLFRRLQEPRQPSWNAQDPTWALETQPRVAHHAMWQRLWRWYHGDGDGMSPDEAPLSQSEVQEKIRQLSHDAATVRLNAADALSRANGGARDAIPALADALYDDEEAVQLNAAYALGALGKEAVPALTDMLCKEAVWVWRTRRQFEPWEQILNMCQFNAAYGLAAVGESAVPALLELLEDRRWQVRSAATAALGSMGRPGHAATPHLIAALQDDSEWVRRNALDALGNVEASSAAAVAALTDALDDERPVTPWSLSDAPYRENAATALAKLGAAARPAMPALKRLLEDENPYMRYWAEVGLDRMAASETSE